MFSILIEFTVHNQNFNINIKQLKNVSHFYFGKFQWLNNKYGTAKNHKTPFSPIINYVYKIFRVNTFVDFMKNSYCICLLFQPKRFSSNSIFPPLRFCVADFLTTFACFVSKRQRKHRAIRTKLYP